MGLFSSSSRSSAHQTTHNTSIDKRVVADNGSVAVSGDAVHLQLLDGGAIAQAFEFAKASDQRSKQSLGDALGWAKEFADDGVARVAQAYDDAKGEATQKNLIAVAALAAVAIVALKVWGK